jgi:hypothetical protein
MIEVNVPAGRAIGIEDFKQWMNVSSVDERKEIVDFCKELGIVPETPKVTTKEDVEEYLLKSGDDARKEIANTCRGLGVLPDTTKEDVKAWFGGRTKEELAEVVNSDVVNSVLESMQNKCHNGKARKDWRACFKKRVIIPMDVMFASLVDHMQTSGEERAFQLGLRDALKTGAGDDHLLNCLFFEELEQGAFESCVQYLSGLCTQPMEKLDTCMKLVKDMLTYHRDDETALQKKKVFLTEKIAYNKLRKNTVVGWTTQDALHGDEGAASCDQLTGSLDELTSRDTQLLESVETDLKTTTTKKDALEKRFEVWYKKIFPPVGVKRAVDAVSDACLNVASGMKRAKDGVGSAASASGQLCLQAGVAAYNAGGVILQHAQPVMQGMGGVVMAIANHAMSDVPSQLALGGPQ